MGPRLARRPPRWWPRRTAPSVAEALGLLGEPPYDEATWPDWTARVREATGRKGRALFLPLRHAVTGRERGPDMAALMPLLQVRPGARQDA